MAQIDVVPSKGRITNWTLACNECVEFHAHYAERKRATAGAVEHSRKEHNGDAVFRIRDISQSA